MDRYFFWSLWTNLTFIFAIIGYLFMDTLDYFHSTIIKLTITNQIYIFLAALFVLNASLQFFVLYHMNKTIQNYSTMLLSAIIDQIGSQAYFYAAIFAAIATTKTNLIWNLNGFGVCAFVIAALLNLMTPGLSYLSILADYLNLLGSIFYFFAFLITHLSLTRIVILFGDLIYLIDAILYMICSFKERKLWNMNKEYVLMR